MADKNELEQELTRLLTDLVKQMRDRLKEGELTASEVKNMIELLKNNNITFEVKKGEIPDGMLDDLPYQTDLAVVK